MLMSKNGMIHEDGTIDNTNLIALKNKVNSLVQEAFRLGVNYGFDMALWLDKNGEECEELGQIKKTAEV